MTVFTVRVAEHNFIILTYLLTLEGRAPRGRRMPPSGKIIVPKASSLPHLIVFLIKLSSSSSFQDNMGGGPNFALRGHAPSGRPLAEKNLTHPIPPNTCYTYITKVSAS